MFTLLVGNFDFVTQLTSWHMRDDTGRHWVATGKNFEFRGIKPVSVLTGEVDRETDIPETKSELQVPRDGIVSDAVFKVVSGT